MKFSDMPPFHVKRFLWSYFVVSIRGGREEAAIYPAMVKCMQKYGPVLNEHVADQLLTNQGEKHLPNRFIHDRDMENFFKADVAVADFSNPTSGGGYEVGRGVERNFIKRMLSFGLLREKPILALYREQEGKLLSAMLDDNPEFTVRHYHTKDEALGFIDEFYTGLSIYPGKIHAMYHLKEFYKKSISRI